MESKFSENTILLFKETGNLTEIKEYGVSWDELTTGKVAPPTHGARFDIAFEGKLEGDISGTLTGVDYLEVRSDGRFMLNIYVEITTDDDERISLEEDGIVVPAGEGIADMQLNMKFSTNSQKYAWLNTMQVWGLGKVDMNSGKFTVEAFTGNFYAIPEAV